MFNKVLIANRGAIACRIIRTLKKLGITSVAVYSDADRHSAHVEQADEAIHIGPAPASESYLNYQNIIEQAKAANVDAIHPGYGFLSENAEFATQCAANNIAFIGPTPQQMLDFGLKHTARKLARDNEVPLLPGTGLLDDLAHALSEATRIGYPVMIKSTAGGGGIGMQLCWNEQELTDAYHSVERLAKNNFSQGGLFLEKYVEKARHIEVQIFGDGEGHVVALGERDCTLQRRNQKVVEETPAPGISDELRDQLMQAAIRLGKAVNYRSAGTVEYVFDSNNNAFYFLEVNTRLQVEHGVTEEVTGVDLVEWMIRQAAGERVFLKQYQHQPTGHAVQVRLYAEDPGKNFQPASGLLTQVKFSDNARVDTYVETGSEVSAFYDPMMAKIIVHQSDRKAALNQLQQALDETQVDGFETNLNYLKQALRDETFISARHYTRYLNSFKYQAATIDVTSPGTQTTIQDWPGRTGYWDIGVPPSGPMDMLSHRLVNRVVGNHEGEAALEITVTGPTLKFNGKTVIAVGGASARVMLNGEAIEHYQPIPVNAGDTLKIGAVKTSGNRLYLSVKGGFDVPEYMGSCATFTLGKFGGHCGRTLQVGDVLRLHGESTPDETCKGLPESQQPAIANHWDIKVMYGPHGAPDFFLDEDIEMFFSTDWEVHYNSSRTGVRLIGPKPKWARTDGGEAGLHPSNIHDNAYAIGAIDFTGDMPVILGPDGPSLGGFVCPATIIQSELWKMGQLKPGDTIRFHCVSVETANQLQQQQDSFIQALDAEPETAVEYLVAGETCSPVLALKEESDEQPAVCYRQAGDNYLLVEYGPLMLDLNMRFRVHALMSWFDENKVEGLIDLTPGIRSLQIHYDSRHISQQTLLTLLQKAETELPAITDMEVPSRIVHLPLSWDDPSTQLAIKKYMQSVRPDAPWCPSNIEFIRRINGLDNIEQVKEILFNASYLVMGLGDVYLGAPVATPMDPRHRLVTTKYNPARTWTPENAVGIGGAYLCVYGMEGPGGYQFVGRTVQMWNRYKQTQDFKEGKQWLLRFFDQLRFYPVTTEELAQMREDFVSGKFNLKIEETTLNLADYNRFLKENDDTIKAFKHKQQTSFDEERERWEKNGQANYEADMPDEVSGTDAAIDIPAGCVAVASPVTGSIWQIDSKVGQRVEIGDTLLVVEAMKMEIAIESDEAGTIKEILCSQGSSVSAGQALVIIELDEE